MLKQVLLGSHFIQENNTFPGYKKTPSNALSKQPISYKSKLNIYFDNMAKSTLKILLLYVRYTIKAEILYKHPTLLKLNIYIKIS